MFIDKHNVICLTLMKMFKLYLLVLSLLCLKNLPEAWCECDKNEHREGIFHAGDEAEFGSLVEHVKALDSCMKGEKCNITNIKYIQDNGMYGLVPLVCLHGEICF